MVLGSIFVVSLEVLDCGLLCCQQPPLIRPSLSCQSEEMHFQAPGHMFLGHHVSNTQPCSGKKLEPEPLAVGIREGAKNPSQQGSDQCKLKVKDSISPAA